jgi:hypothetical protein
LGPSLRGALLAAVVVAGWPVGAGAEEAPASAPAGGAFRAAEWQVRQGQWTFSESGELDCAGRGRSSLLYHATARPRDLDVTVEVMFLGPESSAGVVFRAAGESFARETFYQFEWYTRGTHHDRRLSLMVKNPKWKQIVKPAYPDAPFGRWIALRVRVTDDLIECFVDGRLAFRQRDRTYRRAGRLGLHVWQPRAVKFRGWRLTEP